MAEVLATYTYTLIEDNTAYSVVCSNKGSATLAIIPSTYDDGVNGEKPVKMIGRAAFYQCATLRKVVIPESITSLDYRAFHSCALTTLIIPKNVVSIGSSAIRNIATLTSVIVLGSPATLGSNNFASSSVDLKIYCLTANYDEYKNATIWKTLPVVADDLRIYFTLNADAIKSNLLGKGGSVTIAVADWNNGVATKTFAELGDYDKIEFYPATTTDKENATEADIFVSANGSTVTFTATETPSASITLGYFITRGDV